MEWGLEPRLWQCNYDEKHNEMEGVLFSFWGFQSNLAQNLIVKTLGLQNVICSIFPHRTYKLTHQNLPPLIWFYSYIWDYGKAIVVCIAIIVWSCLPEIT